MNIASTRDPSDTELKACALLYASSLILGASLVVIFTVMRSGARRLERRLERIEKDLRRPARSSEEGSP